MGTRLYVTTNAAIATVLLEINELITWAEADAEHAAENDAPGTAQDDRVRARLLRRARKLIQSCERN